MKTEYIIRDYATGGMMGALRLDDDEFEEYMGLVQQPEGIVSCSRLLDAFPIATMAEPFDSQATVFLE